ncbi:MAG: hypothetical protein H6661_09510 [Ardenticatenaceae bacterium]|nr:hypothetical protein [Ardenticatenaceae bacterium]
MTHPEVPGGYLNWRRNSARFAVEFQAAQTAAHRLAAVRDGRLVAYTFAPSGGPGCSIPLTPASTSTRTCGGRHCRRLFAALLDLADNWLNTGGWNCP